MKNQGGCHCGKIRFETDVDTTKGISCNCSICSKKAGILNFCSEDQFKLITGEDYLSEYQFNKKAIHHLFCKNCGVSPFSNGTTPDGKKMVAINLRCLDGIDIGLVEVNNIDGKSF